MKQTLQLLLLLIGCSPLLVYGQENKWKDDMQQPGANFYEIRRQFAEKYGASQRAFNAKALQKDARLKPDKEADYDLIKFRRWEWYWNDRVNTDGSFPTTSQIREAYNQFTQSATPLSKAATATDARWVNISRTSNSGGYWGMGRASSIGFHPSQPNTFWVTAPNGGVWKTTNGGSSYTPMGDNLPYLGAGSIVVDYANANNIYLATADHTGGNSLGIYKSTDGGTSWAATGLSNNLDGQVSFFNLVQSPTNSATIFAASSKGLYRTTNGGANWTLLRAGKCTDVEIKINDGNTVYAAINQVIYRSADGGNTFTQVLATGSTANTRIAVTKADVNRVLVWDNKGIWMSTDGGASWSVKQKPMDPGAITPECMLISPNNANILYAGSVDIYRSDNGGTSWTKIGMWCCPTASIPEVHADHRNLMYNKLTGEIYSLNDGGVDRYNEANRTWSRLSNGLVIAQYYSAASSATNAGIIGVGSQDNGGSRRESNGVWYNTNGGDAGTQAIDPSNDNIRYSNYNPSPAIIRTTNAWANTTDVRPSGTLASWWRIPYTLDPNNPLHIVVGYHAIYRSGNRGDTWSKISPDFTTAGDYWSAFRAIAIAPSNSSYIYATRPRTIYYTADNGSTWNNYTFNFADLSNVCVKQTDPRTVWVTFGQFSAGNKVYQSTDGGATWVNYSQGLPNIPANDIIYQRGSNDLLYLATDFGVFYRNAAMGSWEKYGQGLPVCPVTDLHIQYSSGKLRAATYARGIYETEILDATASGCTAPQHATTTNITTSSATIAWNTVSTAMEYYIYYKPRTAGSWTLGPTGLTTPTAQLTGLSANTIYDADIWVHCSSGTYLSTRINFTTASSSLSANNISALKEENDIKLYPTSLRTGENIVVDLSARLNSKYQFFISVFDLQGKLLHKRQVAAGISSMALNDLGILHSGIFIIKINEGQQTITKKIVVSN